MRIAVTIHEEISKHEWIYGKDGNKILARDVSRMPMLPTPNIQANLNPPLLWNGIKRNIKKIDNKWYLITKQELHGTTKKQ